VSGQAAKVVIVNISLTHQIVRVVFTAVEFRFELVFLTLTVCPFVTVPAALVHAHPLIEYSHVAQATVIGDGELIQATVIGADVITVPSATFV